MKKTWKAPLLEVLDVSMTMKHHVGEGDPDKGGSVDDGNGDGGLGS